MKNIKFGIISFNDKKYIIKNHNNSFNELSDLPKNIIWYSDISKEELWRLGYLNEINIKHKDYLNTPFDSIKNNIKNNDDNWMIKIFFIFEKIMQLSISQYNLDINASELSRGIRNGLYNKNNETQSTLKLTNFLSNCLFKTYQDNIYCISDLEYDEYISNGYSVITAKKNGLIYSRDIFSKIVLPSSNYIILEKKDLESKIKTENFRLNKDYKSIKDYVSNIETPFLINFNKKTILSKYESQIDILDKNNYTYNLTKRIERNWINSVEYNYLSNFFDFNITKLILFDGIITKEEMFKIYNINYIEMSNISYFSIILTILSENYIISLQEKDDVEHKVNILNSFISAIEKKETLILSLILSSNNFVIHSYGRNKVSILINKDSDLDKMQKIINKLDYYIF